MYASRALCQLPVVSIPVADSTEVEKGRAILGTKAPPARGEDKRYANSGLRKLFNKKDKDPHSSIDQRSNYMMDEVEGLEKEEIGDAMEPLRGLLQPNPNIRPLGLRLEARIEKPLFHAAENPCAFPVDYRTAVPYRDSFSDDGSFLPSPGPGFQSFHPSFVVDSKYGDSKTRSNTGIPGAQHIHYYDDVQSGGFDYGQHNPEDQTVTSDNTIRGVMTGQLDYISSLATQEINTGVNIGPIWKHWLTNYTSGQFNLSHPPSTPILSPQLLYLPAICPPNEEARQLVTTKFEPTWSKWGESNARAFHTSIMKQFDVEYAAIVTFDQAHEYIKVGTGYGWPIKREYSIGAHIVLANETMVIFDASLDWRFRGNPLVTGEHSHIRFFAAAPLCSEDGLTIGALIIYDTKPRVAFTNSQRIDLMSQAKHVTDDLNSLLTSGPLFQHESTTTQDYVSRTTATHAQDNAHNDVDHRLLPPALRFPKMKTPPAVSHGRFVGHPNLDCLTTFPESTPPSSIKSSEENLTMKYHNHSQAEYNNTELSVHTHSQNVGSSFNLVTSDSVDYRAYSPRPWSSSDITSLHLHPPNTPAVSLREEFEKSNYAFTVDDFNALGDDDCAEDRVDQGSINTTITSTEYEGSDSPRWIGALSRAAHEIRPVLVSPTQRSRLRRVRSRIPVTKKGKVNLPPLPMLAPQINSPLATTKSFTSDGSMTEAAFAFAHAAKSLGYDLMYAAELAAPEALMTDEELFKPGVLKKRVLAAYGMGELLELDSKIHIQALRARHPFQYDNENPLVGDYREGLIKCVWHEGVSRRFCTNGIVIGAFRWRKSDVVPSGRSETVQGDTFDDTVESLKPFLLKSRSALPQRANTEPLILQSYPANEATEVGSSSFNSKYDQPARSVLNHYGFNTSR